MELLREKLLLVTGGGRELGKKPHCYLLHMEQRWRYVARNECRNVKKLQSILKTSYGMKQLQ